MRTEQTDDACGDNRRNRGEKTKKEIRKTTKKVFEATKEKNTYKGNTKTSHFYFEYSHAQLSVAHVHFIIL